MVNEFKTRLKAAKYHGTYFDRSSEKKTKICDDVGLFRCEGKYNSAQCCYPKDHIINPYQSAEARVLFSTWNLDHLVERSRSVVPSIISALKVFQFLLLSICVVFCCFGHLKQSSFNFYVSHSSSSSSAIMSPILSRAPRQTGKRSTRTISTVCFLQGRT